MLDLPASKPPPGESVAQHPIAAEQVAAFKEEMTKAGASFRYVGYPGVKHSFTNPDADEYARKFNLPLAYDKNADKNSWIEMKKFLNEIFRK